MRRSQYFSRGMALIALLALLFWVLSRPEAAENKVTFTQSLVLDIMNELNDPRCARAAALIARMQGEVQAAQASANAIHQPGPAPSEPAPTETTPAAPPATPHAAPTATTPPSPQSRPAPH